MVPSPRWDAVLFSFTLVILGLFEVELLLMIYFLGPKKYFSNFLYALDLFIVTVSLVLEVTFRLINEDIMKDLVGILILFRVWRFVRIGHGLVASTFAVNSCPSAGSKEQLGRVLHATLPQPPKYPCKTGKDEIKID